MSEDRKAQSGERRQGDRRKAAGETPPTGDDRRKADRRGAGEQKTGA